MKAPSDPKLGTRGAAAGQPHKNDLSRRTRLCCERRARFEREGERPIGRNLALMGSLGWLIVIPALLGIAAGAWLDRNFGTGVFWTGALLVGGLAIGCWMAWRRVAEEQEERCKQQPR
jgi:ATP synthase protein I